MKFSYAYSSETGWSVLRAERIDFDAFPPVDSLRWYWPSSTYNVDRLVVGASLVFSPWIAGRCDFPDPFSALTEQRVTEWHQARGVWVAPTPVRAGGLNIPRGSRKFCIANSMRSEGDYQMSFDASDAGSGRIGRAFRVASNLGTLSQLTRDYSLRYCMRIGLAVLLGESLAMNEIVDAEFARDFPEVFERTRRLLECVALGLSDE